MHSENVVPCIAAFYPTREAPTFGEISLALRESGAFGATFGRLRRPILLTTFRRVMRIPNMCLVLKFDKRNWFIKRTNRQTDKPTKYGISILSI